MLKVLFPLLIMNSQLWSADMSFFQNNPMKFAKFYIRIQNPRSATPSADKDQLKLKWFKSEGDGRCKRQCHRLRLSSQT